MRHEVGPYLGLQDIESPNSIIIFIIIGSCRNYSGD